MGLPAHWAPNDLLFYKGKQFPARYKNGAFVAFHGSTNRTPYVQGGYIVAFIPFKNGKPHDVWEVFADGFAAVDTIVTMNDAKYRPMGLSEGPDGSLYISETEKGKIWRVMFKGNKTTFGTAQLAKMVIRKKTASNIKDPDPIKDDLDRGKPVVASAVYTMYCGACHQRDGKGDGGRFPPLEQSEWVNGDKTKLINVVLNGLSGPITVKGLPYSESMPAHGSFLNDDQVAEVLNSFKESLTNKHILVSVVTGVLIDDIEQNIQTALKACGASFENVLKLSIHIMQGQNAFLAFQASQPYLKTASDPPAITVLFVSGLANPDYLIEIDAIAFIPEK